MFRFQGPDNSIAWEPFSNSKTDENSIPKRYMGRQDVDKLFELHDRCVAEMGSPTFDWSDSESCVVSKLDHEFRANNTTDFESRYGEIRYETNSSYIEEPNSKNKVFVEASQTREPKIKPKNELKKKPIKKSKSRSKSRPKSATNVKKELTPNQKM